MISFREMRLLRFAYAGAIGARILGGYKLLSLRKKGLGEERYQQKLREHHLRSARWIDSGCLLLQGLMIKIGQTLGSRGDLLPEEYTRVLSRLQDQVPPRPFRKMRPHIERELGAPIEEIFAEFDSQPVAAASLAQVYRARLKDGRHVAVKVIYPNIDRLVYTDLRILKAILWLESRFYSFPLEPVYRELAANIPHEVDMIHEAQNMEIIALQLSHRPDVVIPRPIREWTRDRVLTMDYIDGIKITDFERLSEAGIDIDRLMHVVGEVYMEQLLRHGHFHADPHPGNLFGLPGNRLALLDFGLCKRFSPEFGAAFRTLARIIFSGDDDALFDALQEAGFKYKNDHDPAAARALGEGFRAFSSPQIYRDKQAMDIVNANMNAVERDNPTVDMPGEIALAIRTMNLFLALAFTSGANVDFRQLVLKYAVEPQGVPA